MALIALSSKRYCWSQNWQVMSTRPCSLQVSSNSLLPRDTSARCVLSSEQLQKNEID
jgi:hypothetical protein